MKISDCAALLNVDWQTKQRLQASSETITDLSQNTNQLVPGCCFVAISGIHFDGHAHIQAVADAGARLIIVEKPVSVKTQNAWIIQVPDTRKALAQLSVAFFGDPSAKMKLIGVTGTNGKTTVSHLANHIFNAQNIKSGIIGTLYSKSGKLVHAAANTTPDAYTTHRYLREMYDQGVAACAMEVSSIGLAQGRTWGLDFDVAIFTNLTEDHLDYHKSFEAYFDAKALLFEQLGNTYHHHAKQKTAVINIDDPYGRRLLGRTAANILTYGAKGEGQIQAKAIHVDFKQGTHFTLTLANRDYPVHLQLMGTFNVYNALAAFGACYAQGMDPQDIIDALETVSGVRGRFQRVPVPKDITVIVDYAHTPDGLENVLRTITNFAKKRIYCVVGCGGDRDAEKRPQMAAIALKYASDPVFTADNPRTEDPDEIINQMVVGLDPNSYTRLSHRRQAIHYALEHAKSGDVVLIAGKGHENYQIIGVTKFHFDDVEEVQAYFDQAQKVLD